jgi:glycosyltransferase involved in cell wall biosynthesis
VTVARTSGTRFTVVHAGRRDRYQVAVALHEAKCLDALVTDIFFRGGPSGEVPRLFRGRSDPRLAGAEVITPAFAGLVNLLERHWRRSVFLNDLKARSISDAALRRSIRTGSTVFAYSHSGMYGALKWRAARQRPNILFQLHPHPTVLRSIYEEEMQRNPESAASLSQELEIAWSAAELRKESEEATLADVVVAASSFTKSTLMAAGVADSVIRVLPYGVGEPFGTGIRSSSTEGRLKLLFVGAVTQRKGVGYLRDALRLIGSKQVSLTVATREVVDPKLLAGIDAIAEIKRVGTDEDLARVMSNSDMLLLPSLAEGFGHVILEAMLCGLPVLATNRTCAPDIFSGQDEGFVIEPGSATQIAEAIEWAAANRGALIEKGMAAENTARKYTWERFRVGLIDQIAASGMQ